MKANTFRNIGAAAVLLGGTVFASQAAAVNGALGASAPNTDVWGIFCPGNTASARANVDDNALGDGVKLSMQIVRPFNIGALQLLSATNRTAPDNGGGTSLMGELLGPSDTYFVVINKSGVTAAGGIAYSSNITCRDAAGAVINAGVIGPVLLQSQ